ncbi:MAG: 3'(2'),5'-bisphosphate nucleotidase CysQ [Gammaproteobacteria bacterium]
MPNINPAALLEPVKAIAAAAGEKILEIYGDAFTVDVKVDNSPLTAADLAAHHCIVAGLQKLASYPILSEESSALPYAERQTWTTYWLVDPLDGTKEFIKRNGEFTVNIALIHEHKPALGVVYVPVQQKCYYAAQGVGAFKQNAGEAPQAINVRTQLSETLIVAGSRSHSTPELENYLNNLPTHELISIGSSLKLCLVAEGAADVYPRLGLTSEWDTAAAQCVVEQAGGKVTDLDGNDLEYNRKESLLNPYFLVFGVKDRDWTAYARD